jgi:chromosome segregation ATPase
MAATGELIRLINYVDDINTTLRRISASIPVMDADERKRLAENMRIASSNFAAVLSQLEKGGH